MPAWRKFLAQFNNPLVLLLLGATVVSFIVWLIEKDSALPFEALAILSIVVLNSILGYAQEAGAEPGRWPPSRRWRPPTRPSCATAK